MSQAEEFAAARATQPKPKMKRLFFKGDFGPEFIAAAQAEMPYVWGRLSLLEEFYGHNAPGMGERSRVLSEQLGKPQRVRRSLLDRLRSIFD